MAEVSIFARGQPQIAGVDVDIRTGEMHQSEATITRQPIEDGSLVSDHIVLQPDVIEITAEVSNFDGNDSQTRGERAKTAWQELKKLKNDRGVYEVLTRHELYTDMAIASVTGDNVVPNDGSILLRCRFEKIDKAQASVVEVPESQLAPEVQKSASSQVQGGFVPPITEQDAPQKSQLIRAQEAFR